MGKTTNKWTPEECKYLLEHWDVEEDRKEISEYLKRSMTSCRVKHQQLTQRVQPPRKTWTTEQLDILKDYWIKDPEFCMKTLRRSPEACRKKWRVVVAAAAKTSPPTNNKVIWTSTEDELLLMYYDDESNKTRKSWIEIASIIKTKTPAQCSMRYRTLLK